MVWTFSLQEFARFLCVEGGVCYVCVFDDDGTVPAHYHLPPSCAEVDWLSGPYGGWYGDGVGGERVSHRDLNTDPLPLTRKP